LNDDDSDFMSIGKFKKQNEVDYEERQGIEN